MLDHSKHSTSSEANDSTPELGQAAAIKKFKANKKAKASPKNLFQGIRNQNISALSQSITLIESHKPSDTEQSSTLIKACLPHANKSIRIGITGVPGVGKSTFIESFAKFLSDQGKRVAVLAIDPSSAITKGSILGDKTRMAALVSDKNVFIRPSAAGKALGGVARTTRESIILCEAAGFDVIIIETVGVGQSETTVHSMVDFFLLLKLPGAGDMLQGIKRGIIEMADAIAINKADGDHLNQAKIAQTDFKNALHLYPKNQSGWQTPVKLCSALKNEGIDVIWNLILDYVHVTTANNYFSIKRLEQNKYWLIQTIANKLSSNFFSKPEIQEALNQQIELLERNRTSPFAAAEVLLKLKF
ncbi:methylmalonyl Co-A mutase-associated GTPase MeaB [Tamlana haliotis]|uniref:Methylmalonyl Co-A mutase-associated GTPase MeaB n=1 Tax=Pseudotamlana haliotis TaxID=2614804 RepID=A0A6N6MBR2_9FLAO|nr:methylmalonyl Co-A mutase-associated GTPase MeaB [Tamlana haliotis]KAB1067121.1 methylmalonyl Co-A mutase-associated GTPase MeaB [Tamlana haliotis]